MLRVGCQREEVEGTESDLLQILQAEAGHRWAGRVAELCRSHWRSRRGQRSCHPSNEQVRFLDGKEQAGEQFHALFGCLAAKRLAGEMAIEVGSVPGNAV